MIHNTKIVVCYGAPLAIKPHACSSCAIIDTNTPFGSGPKAGSVYVNALAPLLYRYQILMQQSIGIMYERAHTNI